MNDLKIILAMSIILISPFFINQAFAQSADNQWQYKEQRLGGSFPSGCIFTPNVNEVAVVDDFTGLGHCILFKVFNKSNIINQNLTVTWDQTSANARSDILVLDGSYDRTNSTDFPQNGLPNGFTSPLKFAGVLHQISRVSPFTTVTDVINMTLAGSTEQQVTVAVKHRGTTNSGTANMDVERIDIDFFGNWTLGNSIRTDEQTGTEFDFGFFNFTFASTMDVTPPIITLIGDDPATHLKDSFYTDAGATCIDPPPTLETDVSSNVVIDQSAVNISIVGSNLVTFDCQDSGTGSGIPNNAIQITRTVNVVELGVAIIGGGGSGERTTTAGGSASSVPSLSDIPPISVIPSEPIEEPPTRTLDEIFDLFSFLFEEVEPIPTLEVVPESVTDIPPPLSQPPTPTQEVRPSFIESIQNFFAGLFG